MMLFRGNQGSVDFDHDDDAMRCDAMGTEHLYNCVHQEESDDRNGIHVGKGNRSVHPMKQR